MRNCHFFRGGTHCASRRQAANTGGALIEAPLRWGGGPRTQGVPPQYYEQGAPQGGDAVPNSPHRSQARGNIWWCCNEGNRCLKPSFPAALLLEGHRSSSTTCRQSVAAAHTSPHLATPWCVLGSWSRLERRRACPRASQSPDCRFTVALGWREAICSFCVCETR